MAVITMICPRNGGLHIWSNPSNKSYGINLMFSFITSRLIEQYNFFMRILLEIDNFFSTLTPDLKRTMLFWVTPPKK